MSSYPQCPGSPRWWVVQLQFLSWNKSVARTLQNQPSVMWGYATFSSLPESMGLPKLALCFFKQVLDFNKHNFPWECEKSFWAAFLFYLSNSLLSHSLKRISHNWKPKFSATVFLNKSTFHRLVLIPAVADIEPHLGTEPSFFQAFLGHSVEVTSQFSQGLSSWESWHSADWVLSGSEDPILSTLKNMWMFYDFPRAISLKLSSWLAKSLAKCGERNYV